MTFERAVQDMNRRSITDFITLTPSKGKNMYVCPVCRSGEHGNKTGALKVYTENNGDTRIRCFAQNCFTEHGEDNLGALQKIWGLSALEVLKQAGYEVEKEDNATKHQTEVKKERTEQAQARSVPDYTEKYKEWHNNLMNCPEALEYLHGRGITDDTLKRFMIGYCPDWALPAHPEWKSKRIIFPRATWNYSARILGDGDRRYLIEGSQSLFNRKVLQSEGARKHPVVIVEGEMDTMAVYQIHPYVLGLGSTSMCDAAYKAIKEQCPQGVYIIALDNEAPEKAPEKQEAFAKNLKDDGILCISANVSELYGESKDAAEAAVRDPDALREKLIQYVSEAEAMIRERDGAQNAEVYERSGPGAVDSFLQVIQKETFRPVSSGIRELDIAISGGFIRQSLIMIGGAPGSGKTAIISQITENIIKNLGEDVYFLNLEMSTEVMMARSVARIANENGHKITFTDVLQGYDWDRKGIRDICLSAIEQYKNEVAVHLNYQYDSGLPTTNYKAIMGKIEAEKNRLGHAPIVVLDYLQLLTGEKGQDVADIIKSTVTYLKKYASDNNTLVFCIMATNRESMKTGDAGLFSGRDSSNIEFGADLHLGIEYEATSGVWDDDRMVKGEQSPGYVKKDIEEIKRYRREYVNELKMYDGDESRISPNVKANYEKYCTRFIVRVNKSRYFGADGSALLEFDGARARFITPRTRRKYGEY